MLGPDFLDQRMRCKTSGPPVDHVVQELTDGSLANNPILRSAAVDFMLQGKYRQKEREEAKGTEREKLTEEHKKHLKQSAKKHKADK